jgi:hypothetical protein
MKIAIIKHVSIKDDDLLNETLLDFRAYESVNLGLELEYYGTQRRMDTAWYTFDRHLEWEKFLTQEVEKGIFKDLLGLTKPQEWIREALPSLATGAYNVVILMYQKRPDQSNVTSWTRYGELYSDTDFIEIALPSDWDKKEALRHLTHEIRHVLVNRINRRVAKYGGEPVTDVMDKTPVLINGKIQQVPYYNEFDAYAPDGNRAVQNRFLLNHPLWNRVNEYLPTTQFPTLWAMVAYRIKEMIGVKKDKIVLFADAIQQHEGWFAGSRSRRNHNAGNLRCNVVMNRLAISKDKDGFCVFKNDTDGRIALETMLRNACTGKSTSYKPTMTLLQFFERYAPSEDNNNPKAYAQAVAKHIGVTIDTQIKTLV